MAVRRLGVDAQRDAGTGHALHRRPQFVAVDAPSKPLALLFLGVVFDVNGTLWNLTVAWSEVCWSPWASS